MPLLMYDYSRCYSHDGCDRDWECRSSICQPCCSPADDATTLETQPAITSGNSLSTATLTGALVTVTVAGASNDDDGLGTGTTIGIGVAVPVCVGIIAGIGYLLWRAKRRKRQARSSDREGGGDPAIELDAPSVPFADIRKRVEMDPDSIKRVEMDTDTQKPVEVHAMSPVELEDTSKSHDHKVDPFQDIGRTSPQVRGLTADGADLIHQNVSPRRPLPPSWTVPHEHSDTNYSTQSSVSRVSPPDTETPFFAGTSTISPLPSPGLPRRTQQRHHHQSLTPILPDEMTGRANRHGGVDSSHDSDALPPYSQAPERPSNRSPRGRSQEYMMFSWPTDDSSDEQQQQQQQHQHHRPR